MLHKYKISQNNLEYLYVSAQARMEAHPDYADKHKNNIQNWWILTNDWRIQQSAEYIGMALMYSFT